MKVIDDINTATENAAADDGEGEQVGGRLPALPSYRDIIESARAIADADVEESADIGRDDAEALIAAAARRAKHDREEREERDREERAKHDREEREERHRRRGGMALADIPDDPVPPLLYGWACPDGDAMLFGPGGVGKGTRAVDLACKLVDDGHRILILDYESHPKEWRRRIASLGGPEAVAGVSYLSPTASSWQEHRGPLWEQVAEIREEVADTGATFVIIDSVVPACGSADVMDSSTPARYYAALAELGLPTLSLAHVTKAEEDAKHPYGSVFWSNLARVTWSMAPVRGGAVLTMRKSNDYERPPRELFSPTWADGRLIAVETHPYGASFDDQAPARKVPDEELLAAIEEHPEGMTYAEIGRMFDVTKPTAIRRVKALGDRVRVEPGSHSVPARIYPAGGGT